LASAAFGDAAASLIININQQQMGVARVGTGFGCSARHLCTVTLIATLREVIDSLCDSVWKGTIRHHLILSLHIPVNSATSSNSNPPPVPIQTRH
jgi:hypothetical protein